MGEARKDLCDHCVLGEVQPERILFTNPREKSIGFVGNCQRCLSRAVIVVEKKPLKQDEVELIVSQTQLIQNFTNDIYAKYDAHCASTIGDIKVIMVCPATDAHVLKYVSGDLHVVHETPEDYETLTKPFIDRGVLQIDWVANILEGRSETDRILYSDQDPKDGFVLLPDLKWDTNDCGNLHVLAIARKSGIRSMRDLTSEHLSLLNNILHKGSEVICSRYNLAQDQLRVYVHYPPSYYHFHVHFTHIKHEASKTLIGESHLLNEIIDNISNIDPFYYHKKTISFVIKEGTPLWNTFKAKQT